MGGGPADINGTIETGVRATVRGMGGYRELFNASIADPTAFWADAAKAVTWIREPQQVLDDANPPFYRWFPDGELNTCANALDRHVEGGRAEQPALIYDSPVTGIPTRLHLRANCSTRRHASPARCGVWASARATASSSTCR